MAAWHEGTLCGFDLETTGVDVETARIVTACVMRVDGSGQRPPSAASWVANPGVEIPDGAARIHGYDTARAQAEGQDAEQVIAEVTAMLARALEKGIPVVGYNVGPYDLTLLDRECRRHSLPTLTELVGGPAPVIDAFVLDKHAFGRTRKLTAAAEYWNVRLEDAHTASADAWAAAGVAVRIGQRTPRIGGMSLEELHARQGEWKREQDLGFARWCRNKAGQVREADDQIELRAKAERVERHAGCWPLIPFEARQGALS